MAGIQPVSSPPDWTRRRHSQHHHQDKLPRPRSDEILPRAFGSDGRKPNRLSPHHGKHPDLSNQTSAAGPSTHSYRTNASISSIALSPDQSRLVVGGRDTFTVVRVNQGSIRTEYDIRTTLKSFGHDSGSRGPRPSKNSWENLTIKDVKWMHGSFDRKIVTAAANGQIVLYDLDRQGSEVERLHRHNRQVHRLSLNPYDNGLLLSASQDSTVRLWDLRSGEVVSTTRDDEKKTSVCFAGNGGPVRDVQWSPQSFHEFALGTDGGMVQKWDIRKPAAPLLRLTAHTKPCTTIDWHPNGKRLLSASADKDIKVWDVSSSSRRIKPLQSIRAPQAVTNARWQPMGISATTEGKGGAEKLIVAVSFDHEDCRILIWDLISPETPKHVVYLEEGPASCMLWQSSNLLWSADARGTLLKTNVTDLPLKRLDIPRCITAVRPSGEMTQLLNELTLHSGIGKGSDPNSAQPFAPDRPKSADPKEELDLQLPTELTPYSWASDVDISGLLVDADLQVFTSDNYKDMTQLPQNVSSTDLHLDFEKTMSHNAGVAIQAGQPSRSKHWMYMSLIGRAGLENRAQARKKLRPHADSDTSYRSTDFLPRGGGEHYSHLPSMQGLVAAIIGESDGTIGHLQMVVYTLLNVVPWFPLQDHACSQQSARDDIVRQYHDWLCRLKLHTTACALRKSWARTSPTAASQVRAANATHAKIFCTACQKVVKGSNSSRCDRCQSLLFMCPYCNVYDRKGLWFWCQRCGHGGHMACMQQWYLKETSQASCPSLGCRCVCVPGTDGG